MSKTSFVVSVESCTIQYKYRVPSFLLLPYKEECWFSDVRSMSVREVNAGWVPSIFESR